MLFIARLLASRRLSAVLQPTTDTNTQNFRYLYIEIAFAAILGAIVTFHSAFAVRLGASKELVALLGSIPALVSAVFSIPSARFLRHRKDQRRWIFGSLMVLRVGSGLIALIPLLFPTNTAVVFTAWVILLALPTILFTNGFQAMLADIIPEVHRAKVFATRQIIWSAGFVITSSVAGVWLDNITFPINYQLMYVFGFVVALGSQYYLNKLVLPPMNSGFLTTTDLPVPSKAKLSQPIRRMLFNLGVYVFGLTLPGGLFTIYYIEYLGASDTWLGVNTAAGFTGVIVGNMLWSRLYRNHTYTWGIRRAALMTWIFPVSLALFPNLTVIVFANFVVNLIHPGVELSHLNIMLKLAGQEHRTEIMSWYNTVLNLCMFAAPLVGVVIAQQFEVGLTGIAVAMLASGLLRFTGGVLFTMNPVQEDERIR